MWYKDGFAPMRKVILFTSPEPKLLHQLIPNFEQMITSVKRRESSNFVASNRCYASSSPCGWNIQLQILGSFFFFLFILLVFVNSSTDHNSQRILTYGGSKDVVWSKDVPFGCSKSYNQLLEVPNPSKLLQLGNPSQNKNVRKCWITL